MEYLRTTEAELGIDLDRPLTNKRLKSSIQYEDHPAGTVLNEPVLDFSGPTSGIRMAAVEVPQTLEYMGDQLNAAPVLEVENFTNWKKRFMCHIIDDQMNSVINCLTTKSTWDDLILYHEGPSDVKEIRVMDLKLCYNTLKFKEESELASLCSKLKYEENLINSIYDTNKEKTLVPKTPLLTDFFSTSIVQDFQDSPDDEEDTRSSQEFSSTKATDQTKCHKCGKKGHIARDCWSKTPVSLYHSPFQPKLFYSSKHKPEPRHTKDFEAKYNKDEDEVSSDDNEVTEVKALMALTNEERVSVSKENARNGEWIKISMKKLHTLLEMEDNDDRKSFLDYLCIDLNYVEEQRNNLMLKHKNLVQELNTCKEQLLVLKQAKLDLLTMHHCISEQIPTQKKKILGIDQLTEDTSSYGPKDPIFVKSSADNSEVSITDSNKPKLSKAKDSTLSNHDTAIDYDSANESLVCSTPLPPLEKLLKIDLAHLEYHNHDPAE
ncbi:retrovirus-related pol polyprotein from transposon TNT 1-94 [Tanacetum coccineum]